MRLALFTACALLFIHTTTVAAPTVSGNVISWPDDGWYQVQDESDYAEVCAGGSSCEVDSGSYVVINHSTGERFPGIQVADVSTPITVTGNTISWPNDGWYQVQRADTYESVCGGGRSCDVSDGTYVVINHTTGMRYNSITAPNQQPAGEVVVSGNTISWPDNGWYQVQNASTYESVCEGGLSCDVPNGSYIVINHTTGQRVDEILINISAPSTPTQTIDTDNYENILRNLIEIINAEQLESIRQNLIELYGPSQNGPTNQESAPDGLTFQESIPNGDTGRELALFTCNSGGTLAFNDFLSTQGGGTIVAQECTINSHIYNGSHTRTFDLPRNFDVFENIRVITDSGISHRVSGEHQRLITGGFNFDAFEWIETDWEEISPTESIVVTDYSSKVSTNLDNGPERTIQANFTVRASFSMNQEITVTTPIPFSNSQSTESENNYLVGSLLARANDGSELLLNADTGDASTFNVSVSSNGSTSTFTKAWIAENQLRCINIPNVSTTQGCE